MKTLAYSLFSLSALFVLTAPSAQAASEVDCSIRAKNAALQSTAAELGRLVNEGSIVRFGMGAWTEAVANNVGSATVVVNFRRHVLHYSANLKQVGATADCRVTRLTKLDPNSVDPLARQAEKYKLLIGDILYHSEGDDVWSTFYTHRKVDAAFSVQSVAAALSASEHVDV